MLWFINLYMIPPSFTMPNNFSFFFLVCVNLLIFANVLGVPTAGYRWTNLVLGKTSWSSRLQENYLSFRGICAIYLQLIKENRKITTCNWLDFDHTRILTIMPKNLPGDWFWITNLNVMWFIYFHSWMCVVRDQKFCLFESEFSSCLSAIERALGKTLSEMGLIRLVFIFRHLYFSGVWLVLDINTDIQKDVCFKGIGSRAQNLLSIPTVIADVIQGDLYDHIESTRIFTLAVIMIFIWPLKVPWEITEGTIWIR